MSNLPEKLSNWAQRPPTLQRLPSALEWGLIGAGIGIAVVSIVYGIGEDLESMSGEVSARTQISSHP